ncbi:hypothetical protein FD754_023307 [Muntiacus muntjak]|uniref:GB1/RHD3-type G domain-containing protein n=1 Tax=Muntiacus muntjak TaxID=9888 RepID=A0A5N3UTY6_MUNMU|nr:hypothetical protein FD754_023307 [Muntiacus muntjak]
MTEHYQQSLPVVLFAIIFSLSEGCLFILFLFIDTVMSSLLHLLLWMIDIGDSKNDSWIFVLAVLLSSIFVYSGMSTINLEQLHSMTELTDLLRAKSSLRPDGVEDSTEFVGFFPDFIWTVQDFALELKLKGSPITEDQYLENALKLIPGKNIKAQISNPCRERIKSFFPAWQCFAFDQPTNDKELLSNIENVNFCSYIFTSVKTKTLREGIAVTGNFLESWSLLTNNLVFILAYLGLRTLVVTYVDTINIGAVPCLENAVTTLAQLENLAAMQKAADHYSEQMLQELLGVHAACEREAITVFMEFSFQNKNQEFQKRFVTSAIYCQGKLDELSKDLMENLSSGTFFVPGGHELYRKAKEMLEKDYCQVPRKGVKANEALQNFLESQFAIERIILFEDEALSDGEKAVVVDWARNEIIEKEQELPVQKLQEQHQHMVAKERSLQENIVLLTEKLKRERENLRKEQNMMLEHKLKVNALLNERFRMKSEVINAEIYHLKEMIESDKNENIPWITQALNKVGDDITSILSSPAKFLWNFVIH